MLFLSDFQPDLLIVSAGYDANAADPLADMALQPQIMDCLLSIVCS